MRERPAPPPPPPDVEEPLAEPRLIGTLSYVGGWASRLAFYGLIFTALLGLQYLLTQDAAYRASTAFLGGVVVFLFLLAFVLNLAAHVGRRVAAKEPTAEEP